MDRPNTDDREPHHASDVRPTAWPAAALRIVIEVVVFRVRRLEMANLAAAVAVMLVLRLPLGDMLVRTLFAALLNVLVYLNNDYHDVAIDTRAPDKDLDKARFLAANMGAALRAQWGLATALVAISVWHSPGLVLVLMAGGGICWGYSAYFKHMPWLDVAAMTAWGMVMPLCGSPLDRTLGWALALQLGLFSAVFECIQVVRDQRSDAGQGVRTTAVALGPARTFLLARVLMLLCAAYAALVLHPVAALVALAALLLPMRDGEREAERLWTRVKLIYGSAWLLACAFVYTQGRTSGWLLRLEVDTVLGWR